ncbi:MAG: histidine phosphatase family protein [Acidimicrobiales bacterium]
MTLVRHGETDWNATHRVQGHHDAARLTAQGRQQAHVVANSLRELGFDQLFTSDLDRATQTATIIGASIGLTPKVDPLLRERSFGSYEGGPIDRLTGDVTGIHDGVLVDPDARPPGGESFRDVVARAGLLIERESRALSTHRLLIVTHGGTLRAFRAYATRTPLEGLAWYPVDNCSVWTVNSPTARNDDDPLTLD